MKQDINYEQAMKMLNTQLRQMKREMDEIDKMSLKGDKKKMSTHMHKIYGEVEKKIEKYSKTQDCNDFNTVCRDLEILQPAFTLNYNEICYDQGLDWLNKHLTEMKWGLDKVTKLQHSGSQGEKVKHMNELYDQLYTHIDTYARTHEHHDFENAIHQVEKIKPDFDLDYNELVG